MAGPAILKRKLHPLLQLHAIVSSPVFVGENLARFGSFIAPKKNVCGFAALYSLVISTRAGALPKIYKQTTKSGELCVVKACNERIA
jgi:hypothetical protein